MTTERIPEEVLVAARLRFKRRLAATLIGALAESGMTYEEAEARIGEKKGFIKGYINRLIVGKENGLDGMIDVATALGVEIVVHAQSLWNLPNAADLGKAE